MSTTKRAAPASPQNPPAVPPTAKQEKTEAKRTPLLPVAYGSKQAHVWRRLDPMTWPQFVDWLDLDRPEDTKDCGAYVVGELEVTKGCRSQLGGPECVTLHRNARAVVSRAVLALDADTASQSLVPDAAVELGCAMAAYTTWSHTPEKPRWRLLAPLSRPVNPTEYDLIARAVMQDLGAEQFDWGSREPWRLMHRPSTQGGYQSEVVEGAPLDVDRWLGRAAELDLSARPEPPAPQTDDSPRYADLDAEEQKRLDSYFQASRERELDKLAALPQPWVSGESYWDLGVFSVACNLQEFANSNWCNYTMEQAYQDLLDHAPSDEAWGESEHNEKWESAEATVGGEARSMPPGRSSPEDEATGGGGATKDDGKKVPLSVRLREHVEAQYDAFPAGGDGRIFVQAKQGGRAELLTTNFIIRAAGDIGKGAASLSGPAKEAATQLTALAPHKPPRALALRVHYRPGRVVLDLAQTNSTRCAVVTPEGWTVQDVPPGDVVFQTSGAALPDPERGGSVDELRRLLRWESDDPRWLLVQGWLPACLLANLPRPAVCLFGPQGSAKSTTGRFLTGILDPKPDGVLGGGFGKNRADDETKALKHYIPAWDNVSSLSDEGADFLSRMVTGDLIEKRQLYTDADLVSISYRRTAVITGINMPRGVKPDTLDRLILLALPRFEGERLPEGKMEAEWELAQPRVLAGVLDLAVQMLAGLPTAQNPAGLRMADYAEALWAIDPLLYDAYADNVATARGDMADDDPFIRALLAWLRSCPGQEWEGTADNAQQAGISFAKGEDAWWPGNGRVLAEQLTKASELLRAVGVTVTERRSNGQRRKKLVLAG